MVYANAAYLALTDADGASVRPVERVFIGDPDVSEAVYRMLKAAREGRLPAVASILERGCWGTTGGRTSRASTACGCRS